MTANLEQRAREILAVWLQKPYADLIRAGLSMAPACVTETEALGAIIDALKGRPASSWWEGIETAPKDGSSILATGLNYGLGPDRHTALVYYDEARGGFYDRAESDDSYTYLTHWTPASIPTFSSLPSPPEPAAPELGLKGSAK